MYNVGAAIDTSMNNDFRFMRSVNPIKKKP